MVAAIHYLYPLVLTDPNNVHHIVILVIELCSKIIIGGVTYISAIYSMWYLSGKPETAESRLIEIFKKSDCKDEF